MKIRESGMPQQGTWDAYFDPDIILNKLGLTAGCQDVVEFGCGYGTFTIPAAHCVTGTVYALDIEPEMLATAGKHAQHHGLSNIEFSARDFINEGTGLAAESMDYAMVFNILHHEQPVSLLREAYRNLNNGGRIGIIHWNFDPETPRGPPMSVRPRPEQCLQWAQQAGFLPESDIIELPPYHYGVVLRRD